MPTIQLTSENFKEGVFDYTTEKEWKFKGTQRNHRKRTSSRQRPIAKDQ